MKTVKFLIVALVLTCSMQLAKAQVSVGIGVNIGTPVRRVVVERPYYDDDYQRVVYYDRPVRRFYGRPVYYRTRFYNRPVYRRVVYRDQYYHRGHGRGKWHGRGHGKW